MPPGRAAEYRDLAAHLADLAGEVLRRYFRAPVAVERKSDRSPVTIADREAETAMREAITAAFPEHGVIGEEHGAERGDATFVWVLDPIDGTKAYITGKPTFGTLIALLENGTPILGVIDQPILRERWCGARGTPTTLNGAAARARACGGLGEAALHTTSPDLFDGAEIAAFARVRERSRMTLYGADCYAYALLASGFVDVVVEAGLKPYDYCALVPVIEGAGGVITDWRGAALTLQSDGRVIAAGDRRVHDEALALLAMK